jgi:hypothetical protein
MHYLLSSYTFHTWRHRFPSSHKPSNSDKKHCRPRTPKSYKECYNRGRKSRA